MEERLKLYHPRLWGYDSLFENKFKLDIKEVLQLKEYGTYKGVYRICNHPVISVWIMGDVISIMTKDKFTSYRVDDGTGCIRCVWWHNEGKPPENVQQGCLVTVVGKLTEYRERKQITISLIERATDPNMEVLHWLDVIRLRSLYNTPYIVPSTRNRDLEKLLKEALCSYLASRESAVFTLEELTAECRLNNLLTFDEILDDDVDIECVIQQTIHRMVTEGYFIHQKDNPDHYKLLSDDDIIPSVMLMFHRNKASGMSAVTLHDMLRADPSQKYSRLSIERLKHLLELLVERNIVYPTGDSCSDSKGMKYKTVD